MNYLVWPEGRNLYALLRYKGEVFKSGGFVPYKEEDIKKYMLPIIFVGGDLYAAPAILVAKQIMMVYEQQGPKPSKYDAVIAVFGEARFNYRDFCNNAKYSEKQKQRPYY